MKKIIKREYGAYSIETAVIMTVVFMVILFLITLSHIMYEQTRINAIAQDAAERAGVVYSVTGKDMVIGKVNPEKFQETTPYWRLLGSNDSSRKAAVQEYALIKLNKFKLNERKYVKSDITVNYIDYFVYKRVSVQIKCTYKVPFGGFLSMFLDNFQNGQYNMTAYAEAAVNEQAEMIRNVNMVADIIYMTPISDFLDKYRDKINEINKKISG